MLALTCGLCLLGTAPPSCDQHNQVPAKRVALLASVRRLEGWVGVILSAKVKGVDDCIFVGISQF